MNSHNLSTIDRFRELHRLSLGQYPSFTALYSDYLQTGLRLFGASVGIVSRIEGDRYTVLTVEPGDAGIAAGDAFPLGDTFCSLVVRNNTSIAVEQAGKHAFFSQHPAYRNWQLETYIAAPLWVNGQIFGTLNFTAPESRRSDFDSTDIELIELMAMSIARQIEHDILEQARADAIAGMRENVELFESAFEYATIGMALVAPDGRWLRVNRALVEMLGYREDELLKLDFQVLTHPDDLDADLNYVQEMLAGSRNTYRMEKRYLHQNGDEIHGLLSVSLVRNEDGSPRYFISQIQDITARKQADAELVLKQQQLVLANRKLKELSATDALTHLLNRRAFDEKLNEEIIRCRRTGQPLSLVMLDADHFKSFNDRFGHQAGDRALAEIAARVRQTARVTDHPARYGGEEFGVILPDTDLDGAETIAERIRRAVTTITSLAERVTISLGVACLTEVAAEQTEALAEALVKEADKALYQAKHEGRNRTCRGAQLAL